MALIKSHVSLIEGQERAVTAHCHCDPMSTGTIKDSYNVSSITDHGTGDWSVNFAVAMSGAYAYGFCSSQEHGTGDGTHSVCEHSSYGRSASAMRVVNTDINTSGVTDGNDRVSIIFIGGG